MFKNKLFTAAVFTALTIGMVSTSGIVSAFAWSGGFSHPSSPSSGR